MLCRNGIALEMSMDHKPEDEHELNRIHKAGGKVTCEGRVNGGLNLSRALGMLRGCILGCVRLTLFRSKNQWNNPEYPFE